MSLVEKKLSTSMLIEESSNSDENLKPSTSKSNSSLLKRKQHNKEKEHLARSIQNTKMSALKSKLSADLSIQSEHSESRPASRKGTLTINEQLLKSRKIFRQMAKKNRWVPNENELKVLRSSYEKNSNPKKDEKLAILLDLESKTKSKVTLTTISKWFEYEREESLRLIASDSHKNTYKKFSHEELRFLRENFNRNTYPKTEEMRVLAKKLSVSLSKIENWYKHNRRSLAKKGCFVLKSKKYFKKEEINYLVQMFETHPRPNKQLVVEMARNLECTESQIKNWYSNKRKKQKSADTRPTSQTKSKKTTVTQIEVQSTSSSNKDSRGSPFSPPSEIHLSLNTNKSAINPTAPEKSPSIFKMHVPPQSQGFKVYTPQNHHHHHEDPFEKRIPPLVIPTPSLTSPIPQLKTPVSETFKFPLLEDRAHNLKANTLKIGFGTKTSPESSPSFTSSLSNKVQTTSQISPSFRLNTSATVNTENISKLLSPNNLNQLQVSLNLLNHKGKADPSPKNTPNYIPSSNLTSKCPNVPENEDAVRLKYLSSLCNLNNSDNIFNKLGYSLLFNNPSFLLQNTTRLPSLVTESTSKNIPPLGHSIFPELKSNEKSEFHSMMVEKDIELRKV